MINGFSKAYAMTGWRLGYACGPANIIEQMTKIHQFAIMCAPTTSQYAAVEALKNGDDDIAEMRTAYNQRRRFLMNAFREMGLECFEPYGAFYVFPCIKEFGMTSDEFATRFLEEEEVEPGIGEVTIPYEFLPLPKLGDQGSGLGRDGRKICRAVVSKVRTSKQYDHTCLLTLKVPMEYLHQTRFYEAD